MTCYVAESLDLLVWGFFNGKVKEHVLCKEWHTLRT